MNHRRSGRRRVGRTTGGRGHDQPIALHRRDVLPVQKQIDVGQVRRHAPIDDDLVEDLEIESELLEFELQEAIWGCYQNVGGRILGRFEGGNLLLGFVLPNDDAPQPAT